MEGKKKREKLKQVSFYLRADEVEALDEFFNSTGMSRNGEIRKLIRDRFKL